MLKYEKCSFGYLKAKKQWNLIKLLIGFAVVLGIFFTGYIVSGTRNNLATVAAIVLVLPVGKFAVEYFILLPHKSCGKELYETIMQDAPDIGKYFDCVFSNQKKPIGTLAVVVTDSCICAYTEEGNADLALFESSVKEFLKNDKLNVTVTLYKEKKTFIERVKKLQANANQDSKDFNDRIMWNSDCMKKMCL